MTTQELTGTWKLSRRRFYRLNQELPLGKDSGVLVYTTDGHFSVSINAPIGKSDDYPRELLKDYFSAGTYQLEGDSITEHHENHFMPERIGTDQTIPIRLEKGVLQKTYLRGSNKIITKWVRA